MKMNNQEQNEWVAKKATEESEKAEHAAYAAAIAATELDVSHPYVRLSDGTRYTVSEYEQMTKPGQKAKKVDFEQRPKSQAAVTPGMLAMQGVWSIERQPSYWDRDLVDKIANRLYVRNNDPSRVIVEAVYESLSANAKAEYTRIESVQYATKAKQNPVPWSEVGQRMSEQFRKLRAEVILRAPDCDVWRPQFERLIEDGAEVMVAAELATEHIRHVGNMADACLTQIHEEVPGE